MITPNIRWQTPHFYFNDAIFYPKIYDAHSLDDTVPEGFNAVIVSLEASQKASLNWQASIEKADEFVKKGLFIFWELHFSLFENLLYPLSNQTQFLSLTLAIDHFHEMIWSRFHLQTLGVCIYRGSKLDDAQAEYLQLLACRFSESPEPFIFLKADEEASLLEEALMLNKERYAPLQLAVHSKKIPSPSYIAWESGPSSIGFLGRSLASSFTSLKDQVPLALCLPEKERFDAAHRDQLSRILQLLHEHSVLYRIIPEETLVSDWEYLDDLIVLSSGLRPEGKRKLQGFCAAGGCVITEGNPIGLSHEISFNLKFWVLANG